MKTSCELIPKVKNSKGEEVDSQLYKDLKNVLPKGEAKNMYELIKSEQFKTHTNYNELEKDENGEPTIQTLFEHTPLNKRISDSQMEERLIHKLGIRSVDKIDVGNIGSALLKVIQLNNVLKNSTNGEQFFRVVPLRKYNPVTRKMYLEMHVYRTNKNSDYLDYQLENLVEDLTNYVQQIGNYTVASEILYKVINTFPMEVGEIGTFNSNVIHNIIKEIKENVGKKPIQSIDAVNIAIGSQNYERALQQTYGITDEDWLAFIDKEKIPINISDFKNDPKKYYIMLRDLLFNKYLIDHAVVDVFLGANREMLDKRLKILKDEVIRRWDEIKVPEYATDFNIEDTLIMSPESDPLYIDIEQMIKELGDKYNIETKTKIGAKELLFKIIQAEKNQSYIQKRIETNEIRTIEKDNQEILSTLSTFYENAEYETAIYEYYNYIIQRIKEWKNIVESSNDSIETAKVLRQAHLELVMFHEISDYVRKYKDVVVLNKKDILSNIYQAMAATYGFETTEEVDEFFNSYKKDSLQFKKDYPEAVPFAQAFFDIETLDESKGLSDVDAKVVPLIKDLEDVLNQKIKAYTVNFLKEYQDPEAEIVPFGKNKGQVNDIEQLLSFAQRDMYGIERLLDSLGDSPDMILRLIDKVAKQAKNQARIDAVSVSKEIMYEAKLLEKAGIKDTSWMFARDENGNKTGKYVKNGDPEMVEINADPAKLRWYNFFIHAKQFLDSMYPPNTVRTDKIISINKDLLERLKESDSIIDMKNEYLESIKDEWLNRNAEDEDAILGFSQGGFTLNGEEINVLPIFYQNVDFSNKKALNSISEDTVSTLIAYAAKAIDYNESNKIINKIELAKLVLSQRQIPIKRNGINVINTLNTQLNNEQQENGNNYIYYKDNGQSNISQRLGGFLDVMFYAKSRRDESIGKFSAVKIVDKLNAWTARAAMSLSLLNGISNVATGNMMMVYEALSKRYFKPKDLLKADGIYSANILPLLGNLGNAIKDDKLSLFNELFDVTQEYDKEQLRDIKWDRKTKLGKLEIGKAMMFMQDSGEHWMANRTALCLALNTMLVDKEGNSHTLWDSLEVEYVQENGEYGSENLGLGARLKIKDGYTKEDGSEWSDNDVIRLQLKCNSINQGMHGIYNKMDSNMIQMTAVGRLAYIFRKWIWKSYTKRFENTNYNYNIGEWNEGYYRSAWNFISTLASDVKNCQLNVKLHWSELHPTEKQNILKAIREIACYLLMAGINALIDLGDDDDDKDAWLKNMTTYQMIRLQSELGALTPVGAIPEFIRLGKSPIPALNTVNNILETLGIFWIPNYFEEVDRGWAKGHSKAFKCLLNNKVLNAYWLTYQKTFPELHEQSKWYQQ